MKRSTFIKRLLAIPAAIAGIGAVAKEKKVIQCQDIKPIDLPKECPLVYSGAYEDYLPFDPVYDTEDTVHPNIEAIEIAGDITFIGSSTLDRS